MKKIALFAFFASWAGAVQGQIVVNPGPQPISECSTLFEYDAAGNRVHRYVYCPPLPERFGPSKVADYLEVEADAISISPNPVTHNFSVAVSQTLIGTPYVLIDPIGKVVKNGMVKSENTVVEVQDLAIGVYYLHLGNEKRLTRKVLKN